MKKALQCLENACIMNVAVTLIAMKREVAAIRQVFRGANVKLETDDKSLYRLKFCRHAVLNVKSEGQDSCVRV